MDKSELAAILDTELRAAGFKKKGATWYSATSAGVLLFNLQKSQWSDRYSINLASTPAEIPIEGLPTPKYYKCLVNIRLEDCCPDLEQKSGTTLNLEDTSLNDTDRAAALRQLVNDYAVPFLRKMDGLGSIKRSIDDGTYPRAFIPDRLLNALNQQ